MKKGTYKIDLTFLGSLFLLHYANLKIFIKPHLNTISRKNEEIDDKSMIRRLRKRISELETQVALLQEGQVCNGML